MTTIKTVPQLLQEVMPNIKEISIDQLKGQLDDPNSILIDVREPGEFNDGHIDGAVSFPRGVLEMKIHTHPSVSHIESPQDALGELNNKTIHVICMTGGRSALAAESLQRMGFENVLSVKGGMKAWNESQ